MCHPSVLAFVEAVLRPDDIRGKDVLEVGSYAVNGSPRGVILAYEPRSYVGVDVRPGPGVDEVCDATRLVERFGQDRFDLVVSTETLEHVEHWQRVVSNLKRVLRTGGVCVVTTRSPGFPLHHHPLDFWRYTVADVEAMFADCTIVTATEDPEAPGVFAKVVKPPGFTERDLSAMTVATPPRWVRAEELLERDERIADLQQRLHEQWTWAARSADEVAERDAAIRRLQASLLASTRLASRTAEDVAQRDAVIVDLQASLAEQTRWAQTSVAEVAHHDAVINELQASLAEQTRWAQACVAEVARRDAIITELQASLAEQTRWAQACATEVARRDAIIADLQAGRAAEGSWGE